MAVSKMLITLERIAGAASDCTIILQVVNCATPPKPVLT